MKQKGISSFSLHVIAMICMVCDHAWALLLPQAEWLTCIGRIAFPIFAFAIAEGYRRTSDVKRYMQRLLISAILSEMPFNLMYGCSLFYPFHQNVLWTFLIALCAMAIMDQVRKKYRHVVSIVLCALITALSFISGYVTMADYFGPGVLTVLVFYFFSDHTWSGRIGQLVCLSWINLELLGGYYYPIHIGGFELDLIQQGFALLALIPIWFYNGEKGYHKPWFRWFCYAFYPVHMLVLYGLWQILIR